MFFKKKKYDDDSRLVYFDIYRPYVIKTIHTLKNKENINYFANKIFAPILGSNFTVCIVPSHDNLLSGIKSVMKNVSSSLGLEDGTDYLQRTAAVDCLHVGGNRHIDTHLKSISLSADVAGKKILLVDDVVTTGNSMKACKDILLHGRAATVQCLAIAVVMGQYHLHYPLKQYFLGIPPFTEKETEYGRISKPAIKSKLILG